MKKHIIFIIIVLSVIIIGFASRIFIEWWVWNIYAKWWQFFTIWNNLYAKDNQFPYFYKIANNIKKPIIDIQGLFVKDQKNIYFAHCPWQIASWFDTQTFNIYTGEYFSGNIMVQDKNGIYIFNKTWNYWQTGNYECKYPWIFSFTKLIEK